MLTRLVILGDYSDDQAGYNEAHNDGAVHVVEIDEQSYSSMYNVQKAIATTCECTGSSVSLGLVRDGKYIPLSVVEDTSFNSNLEYQDLDEAFEVGLTNIKRKAENLNRLRDDLRDSLAALQNALPQGEERRIVGHCIDSFGQYAIDQSKL